MHEVSSTGAAISLALLLQARSEHASGSDSESEGGVWAALAAADEQQRSNSSAALGALSFLQPCAHG